MAGQLVQAAGHLISTTVPVSISIGPAVASIYVIT
jgi:hypothetical protein